jgi:iron complex outermembrane recepter protein
MSDYNRLKTTLLVSVLSGSAGLLPGLAQAQGADARQAARLEEATTLAEVVVSARRREESLQEVPLAISAVSGADLESRGVANMGNLNSIAPNFSVMGGGNSGESQANFRVRGMPGVSVYVDGVNQATTDGLLTMSVVEVDRIEVLRGPQGTLFGNTSLGGAVHYITREPGDTFGVRFKGSIGAYDRKDLQAAIDLPLAESFKLKLTGSTQKREGFIHSQVINRSYGDINDTLYRADMVWTPFDGVKLRYNYEKTNVDREGPARVVWEIAPVRTFTGADGSLQNANANVQAYANAFNVFYNNVNDSSNFPGSRVGKYQSRIGWENPGLVIDSDRHTFDGSWQINDTFRIRSISGYKELVRAVQVDFDGAQEVSILERDNRFKAFNFTQELQFAGSHRRADWVVGGYYSKERRLDRTVTWVLPEFTCDIWNGAVARGVSASDRALCLANRQRALGAPSTATGAALNAFNNNGVTAGTFAADAPANGDNMTITLPETRAIFADATWRFTDAFSVSAGVRRSEDKSPGNYQITGANLASRGATFPDSDIPNYFGYGVLPTPTGATEFKATTKRLTLQYKWAPDIMTYIGYSDGYQPGGASATPPNIVAYMSRVPAALSDVPATLFRAEQTVKSYEIGLRADWFERRLRTNVTAFFTDWKNVNSNQYIATTFFDTNADGFGDTQVDLNGDGVKDVLYFPNLWNTAIAKAEVKGVEFEGVWLAAERLRLGLNVGYLDTAYKELGQAGLGAVPAVTLNSAFAQAPKYTANASVSYDIPLAGGAVLLPRLDYTYTDDYALASAEALQRIQKGFGLLNARITYDSGKSWDVSLEGTNLTNEYYFNSGFYTRSEQIHFMTLGRPREWGLVFNVRFD